jgi:hypothetical protein
MNEMNPFADFQFELGDIVHQKAHPSLLLIVLGQLLCHFPGGVERAYFVRGGNTCERFEGELCEIELQKLEGTL